MTPSEAESIIVEWLRSRPHPEVVIYGYDVYIQAVIYWHTRKQLGHHDQRIEHQNLADWSPSFATAAWDLARRGVVRPGVRSYGKQSTEHGDAGYGFSVTPAGEDWLQSETSIPFIPTTSHRFAELLGGFRQPYGDGYFDRTQEAVRCFRAAAYLACCAMCGAAAESILLAAAVAKDGSEERILETYRSAQGRGRVRNLLVGSAGARVQRDMDTFLGLLNYWRDEAAHGLASCLGATEAELALVELGRFAAFVRDNWDALTRARV